MSEHVAVIREQTILRCHGPHPQQRAKHRGQLHLVQVGPPLPVLCRPTGRVWHVSANAVSDWAPDGRADGAALTIPALCKCGIVTEYEIVPAAAS